MRESYETIQKPNPENIQDCLLNVKMKSESIKKNVEAFNKSLEDLKKQFFVQGHGISLKIHQIIKAVFRFFDKTAFG